MGSASQLVLIKPVGALSSPAKQPPTPPESVTEVPYFNGDHLLVAAALGGGNTISNFVETLQGWLKELGLGDEGNLHFQDVYERVMQSALEKLDTTLQMDLRLWGERHAPDVRGRLWNVAADNTSLGDVGSAMVRGVVENLHAMMSPLILQHYQVYILEIRIRTSCLAQDDFSSV